MAVGQLYLRPKLPAKLVWLNIRATHLFSVPNYCSIPINNGSAKDFVLNNIYVNSVHDLISTVLNLLYTWIISSLHWSLFWNTDDEVRKALQYLKWLGRQISLLCAHVSLVLWL